MSNEKMNKAFEAWLEEGIEETGTVRPSDDKVASYLAVWEGAWQAATAATQRDAMAVAEAVRDACKGCECADGERFIEQIDLAAIVEAVRPAAASGAAADLERVYDEFGIGAKARSIGILLGNVSNAMRRAECLAAIEREFFMVPGEVDEDYPDQEPSDECLLNWGHGPADYVESFREALRTITAAEAAQTASAQQQGEPVAWRVMNGVHCMELFVREGAAKNFAAGEQKLHDLSGSLAAIRAEPLYTTPPAPACSNGTCAECGKKDADGYALYCVGCIDKHQLNVPEGFTLVPVEPTQAMHDAGRNALATGAVPMEKVYRAMLAAAPKPEGV